jgi:hypothetical protein
MKFKIRDDDCRSQSKGHKSSGYPVFDEIREVGQKLVNQWRQYKKPSMMKGERESVLGSDIDNSFLEIPNEHALLRSNTKTTPGKPPTKNFNSSKPSHKQRSGKKLNINTVRDSSPLKTITSFKDKRSLGRFNRTSNNQQVCHTERSYEPKDKGANKNHTSFFTNSNNMDSISTCALLNPKVSGIVETYTT